MAYRALHVLLEIGVFLLVPIFDTDLSPEVEGEPFGLLHQVDNVGVLYAQEDV